MMRVSSILGILIIISDDVYLLYLIIYIRASYYIYKSITISCDYKFLPWQFLNFLPLPHGHGSFGRGMRSAR